MSTVKNPRQKKRLSLERDRRNTYGENAKASRKNIARGKQRQHMDERRAVHQVLHRLQGPVIDEDLATDAELAAKVTIADSRHRGLKKQPDTPLGEVLKKKTKKPTRLYL
jgi:hypothetical protein